MAPMWLLSCALGIKRAVALLRRTSSISTPIILANGTDSIARVLITSNMVLEFLKGLAHGVFGRDVPQCLPGYNARTSSTTASASVFRSRDIS